MQKKVDIEDQKENLSEKVEKMDIEEVPKSSKITSRDEEVVKKRRKVILDSSDEDELPKVKKPRTGLNKSLASSSEDEDHDEDDDDESDSSSALSDADLQEEDKEDGISEDELEFLKRDAERHNLDKQGSRPSRRKRSPVRRKAKIERGIRFRCFRSCKAQKRKMTTKANNEKGNRFRCSLSRL